MELDKIPGFWVVTCWPRGEVALRLKIRHNCDEEPIQVFCEIRVGRGTEFALIKDFESSEYELMHPDESDSNPYDQLPDIWRAEFTEMARRWAACGDLIEFGSSEVTRYAEEPASSRDAFDAGTSNREGEDVLRAEQRGDSVT
jgi:hypothetical protein